MLECSICKWASKLIVHVLYIHYVFQDTISTTVKPVYPNQVTYGSQFSDLVKQVAALQRSICIQATHLGIIFKLAGLNR